MSIATPIPSQLRAPVFSRRVLHLLLAQTAFGFGWSLYLLLPKFYATALSAGPETIGRISAMTGIVNVLAMPVAMRLIDRGSRKTLFHLGCAALCVLSIGFSFVDHVSPALFVLQGMVGLGFVFTFNATATMVTEEVPPERMGQALGLVGASNMVMNAISTVVGEALSLRYGWQPVFALAVVSSFAALAVTLPFREAPRDHDDGHAESGGGSASLSSMASPLIASMAMGATFIAMFVFYQPYALSLGATEVRDFFVGFTATAVGVRVFLGNLGDRLGRTRVSIAALLLYALSATTMVWLNIGLLALHGALLGLAHGVLYPTLNAVAIERVSRSARGRAITLYSGAFSIGSGLAGVGWGELAKYQGYPAVFVGGALLSLLGAAALLWNPRPNRAPGTPG